VYGRVVAGKQLEVDFLAACRTAGLEAGDPALQICAVLDRLPAAAVEPGNDAELIDQIDALMDDCSGAAGCRVRAIAG
jgi:hypothetical protein